MPLLASSVHQLEEKVNYRLLSLCIKRHTGHKLSRRVSVYAPIVSSTFCGSGYECFHSVIKLSTRPVLESIPKAVYKERMYTFDQQSNECQWDLTQYGQFVLHIDYKKSSYICDA